MSADASIRQAWHQFQRPGVFITGIVVLTVTGLWLDSLAGLGLQLVLSASAWAVLLIACVALSPLDRARVAVVVVVATAAEVVCSLIWGIYDYRLGNLPVFVPAGHGLVYLVGYRFSQTRLANAHHAVVRAAAIAGVATWAALGLSGVLGRIDVAGAIASVVLIGFLLRGRAPELYAGVFFFVAFLEIWGTWVGTWRWQEYIPGLGLMSGNPPSGAAAGYVLFDIAALALAPGLLAVWLRLTGGAPHVEDSPVTHEVGR